MQSLIREIKYLELIEKDIAIRKDGKKNMKIHVIRSDHSVINLYTCMYILSTGTLRKWAKYVNKCFF